VFIADSRAPAADRAALMAKIARVTIQTHRSPEFRALEHAQ